MMKQLFACIFFAAIIFFAAVPFLSHAKHGQVPQWVDESSDMNGNKCCGQMDCVPVASVEILEEGAGFADVRIDGREGIVEQRTLIYVCPENDQRSFICFSTAVLFDQEYRNCLTKYLDGTYDMLLIPGCVRCLLLRRCLQNHS
jgi:hypothetical protein